jgi:hypothetical protein
VRDQLAQNESELGCANGSTFRMEQDPNLRAFQMRDQPGLTFMEQQHVVERLVELGRVSVDERKVQKRQSLMTNRNGREWRSEEEQGTVMDRQGRERSRGGPEAESMANPGLESSKVENDEVIPSKLSQSHGEGKGKEGEHIDVQSPVAFHVARIAVGMSGFLGL